MKHGNNQPTVTIDPPTSLPHHDHLDPAEDHLARSSIQTTNAVDNFFDLGKDYGMT